MKISAAARKAIWIGSLCSVCYLGVYVARNILGTVTPQMIEGGGFSTEEIGTLSSIYFITYAVGQLINGLIGDKIKSKYMISLGLALAGICNYMFSVTYESQIMQYIAYGLVGFFLSMIYGPMSKLVAENIEPVYAMRTSAGYTFASLFGSPMAGLLAAFMTWQVVFFSSSAILILMGCLCFIGFSFFERKGMIEYNKYLKPKETGGRIKILVKNRIIRFTFISAITGIIRTTVVFWLPTYISQYLGFSPEDSAKIFTVATLVISASIFIAIFVYESLGKNMELAILISFFSSAICFFVSFAVNNPIINISFLVMAILASNCAASILWSRYCPGLRDTGMVSSATGFLDFISYMAASASSSVFANLVVSIGWNKIVFIWFILMVFGVMTVLPYERILNKKAR